MEIDRETHKDLAVRLNGEVWTLLEKPERSESESSLMIHAAHASLYHWLQCGSRVNEQRGEWLVSRVYAVLGYGESSLRHALRCRDITERFPGEMKDFDRAYSCECLARAHRVLGNPEAEQWRERARELGDRIENPDDKRFFNTDFAI